MKKITLLVLVLFCSISINAQVVSTFAGSISGYLDAVGTAAQFRQPSDVCYDGLGNLYLVDETNNRIRKVEIATGTVTTLAGSTEGYADGIGIAALFSSPYGICYYAGNLFVVSLDDSRIRKIEIATAVVTTLAGNTGNSYAEGIGTAALFSGPTGLCSDGLGNLYVADKGNNRIRKIEIATATVTTIAGSGSPAYSSGYIDGLGASAKFNTPFDVCYDGIGNLYVADRTNQKIRKIEIATTLVTTLAGSTSGYLDGIGTAAKFNYPVRICSDGVGSLYVSDYLNYKIRKIEIATATVTTLAGTTSGFLNGSANIAKFGNTNGICTDTSGNLYVSDTSNHLIRKITGAFLDVNDTNISKIQIYPNPVSNTLTIKKPSSVNLQLQVINQLGQLVLKQIQNASSTLIDVSTLSKGLYFLNISSEANKTQTIKFIKN